MAKMLTDYGRPRPVGLAERENVTFNAKWLGALSDLPDDALDAGEAVGQVSLEDMQDAHLAVHNLTQAINEDLSGKQGCAGRACVAHRGSAGWGHRRYSIGN